MPRRKPTSSRLRPVSGSNGGHSTGGRCQRWISDYSPIVIRGVVLSIDLHATRESSWRVSSYQLSRDSLQCLRDPDTRLNLE